jgi:hypothetical protein
MSHSLILLLLASYVLTAPWDRYNLAPESRIIRPVSIFTTKGSVENATNILSGKPTGLIDQGSYITLDFGKNVGGILTLHVASVSAPNRTIGLSFSESSLNVGIKSDDSAGRDTPDGAILISVSGATNWTMPPALLRGGFKYLTIFQNSSGRVNIDQVSVYFTASPDLKNPKNYPNYFYSNDDLLNRIWYAGAYTVQLCTIPSNQGRAWPPPQTLWKNDFVAGQGNSILVDGAKRDRAIWAGDMGIAVPTAFVTTNDLVAIKNSLTTLFSAQKPTGELPWSGPNFNNLWSSDTYHMWTLIASAYYYEYTRDKIFLDQIWEGYKLGVQFIFDKINKEGLLYVTGRNDWLRSYQGGDNIEANAIAYKMFTVSQTLSVEEGDQPRADTYLRIATKMKKVANQLLWDPNVGLYKDNSTSTSLYPQDGNALSIWFGLVDSQDKIRSIIKGLKARWTNYGPETPEKSSFVQGTVSIGTFTGSMEVFAHFVANEDNNALELIRRQWGHMLNTPIGTNSTFWEGMISDGTFNWIGSTFSSLAHGWSTGPVTALTYYVLGIMPKSPGVSIFSFIPHPGDLVSVEGKLQTPNGFISAKWKKTDQFIMEFDAPKEVTATVGVPTFGKTIQVTVNGNLAWDGKKGYLYEAHSDGSFVYLESVWGGQHYTVIGK